MNNNDFQDNLRKWRMRRGLTRQDMASKLNMTAAAYGFYETGRTKPDVEKLVIISKTLNISPNELLNFSNDDEYEYYKKKWIKAGYKVELKKSIVSDFSKELKDIVEYEIEGRKYGSMPLNEFIYISRFFENQSKKIETKAFEIFIKNMNATSTISLFLEANQELPERYRINENIS